MAITRDELTQALKEDARALRVISIRRSVLAEDEDDLRQIAASLEALALEVRHLEIKPNGR